VCLIEGNSEKKACLMSLEKWIRYLKWHIVTVYKKFYWLDEITERVSIINHTSELDFIFHDFSAQVVVRMILPV
jgi:mannose/cellobiose epimerase-like protein (N-acyl-D-glucosamine 2-epimerase family)